MEKTTHEPLKDGWGECIRGFGIALNEDRDFRVYRFHWTQPHLAEGFAKLWGGIVDKKRSFYYIFVKI